MKKNNNSTGIYMSRTIGFFFLLAFFAYGFGRYLFERESYIEKYVGAWLILANSIIVLCIVML